MEEEVARQRARDRQGYWPNGPNWPNRANKANRGNKANKANKANWPYQKEKKFGFNNTELINLVLIMFPAGSH